MTGEVIGKLGNHALGTAAYVEAPYYKGNIHVITVYHMAPKKLNLGCGSDIREGWVNLDSASLPEVDGVHNIEKLPLPFADNSFDEIRCQDILEHVEYIPILKDLHRILAPGGTLSVRVPHFTARNNYMDPTHRRMFSVNTFNHFVTGTSEHNRRPYYFDFTFGKIRKCTITFEHSSSFFFYNKLVRRIVNKTHRRQELYEASGFSRLFPALNIDITLIK